MNKKNKNYTDSPKVFANGIFIFKCYAGVILLLYLLSGIYVIQPDEQAIVTRFGRLINEHVMPGIHYHLPYPVDVVKKMKVKQVKRISIGFEPENKINGTKVTSDKCEFFTGDENIIKIKAMLQYTIRDAAAFRLNAIAPHILARKSAEAALMEIVGSMGIDDILTSGKLRILRKLKEKIQKDMNYYRTGIQIVALNFQEISPPDEVADAFRDVTSAKADKSRYINQAYGYKGDILPKARGNAQRIISEANAYKIKKILKAQGEVDRYLSIFRKYKKSPEITVKRFYIEAMKQILPKLKKIIVDESKKMENKATKILDG